MGPFCSTSLSVALGKSFMKYRYAKNQWCLEKFKARRPELEIELDYSLEKNNLCL